jgi:hypothetical protein
LSATKEEMSFELQRVDQDVIAKTIKKDIEPAYNHTKNHITSEGEILQLDSDCEYCKVYFEEQRILNK